jgi:small subunit ribosomal protein S16
MATKIRLQRHGKKAKAFYHIVAADTRAKRDGRFIEKLGTYNPNTNPATVNIDFDRTLYWVGVGAEMTDTARALLSYQGVLYKNHLLKGVTKGALTEAQVEERFDKWMKEKTAKIDAKKDGLTKSADKAKAEKLKAEAAVSAERAKAIEEKNNAVEAEDAEAATEEAPAAEAATEEAPAAEAATEEAPAAEAATEEAPAAEAATEEAPAAEAATEEAPAAEAVTEEAPVADAATEEAPAAEATTEEAPAAEAATEEAPADEEPKAE